MELRQELVAVSAAADKVRGGRGGEEAGNDEEGEPEGLPADEVRGRGVPRPEPVRRARRDAAVCDA